MTLKVKVNGIVYENFIQAEVTRSMESLSGAFSFSSTITETSNFPIKKGDQVDILADGIPILKGYIEKISGNYNSSAHDITLTGRSRVCDIIDSSVIAAHTFKGGSSLVDIMKTVLSDLGLSSISVTDKTDGISAFTSSEITAAALGDKAFSFIESYARKRQVLLNDDGEGNIILTRGGVETQDRAVLMHKAGSYLYNNILSSSFTDDDTERYNSYTAYSQLNPAALSIGTVPKTAVNQKGMASDTDIRTTRKIVFNTEESSDNTTAADRATWEANVRRAKSLSYKPVVQGHSIKPGILWRPNIKVMVEDDFWGISAYLLVRGVTYTYSLDGGSITTLDMTYNDAYILQASVTSKAKATEKVGEGLRI